MTREEAISELRNMRDGMPADACAEWVEAIRMAIADMKMMPKLLEQPQGDLISRQQAITRWNEMTERGRTEFDQELMMLPSVQKTGKWIAIDKGWKVTRYECSECKRFVMDDTGYDVAKDYPYCHCGARMVGEQE